jgi:hypothetical protein
MDKLVMCAAYGYGAEDLKPFVHSLRKHYDDKVLFIVETLTDELRQLFGLYGIQYLQIGGLEFKNDIQWLRYRLYEFLLQDKTNVNRVFVSDVRDVIFQDDPFKYSETEYDLEFFEEPDIIRNCHCNGGWTLTLFGPEGIQKIGDKNIICSGTTMGSRMGMLKYFDTMNKEIESFQQRGVRIKGGEDQPIHFYSIYDNKFENYKIHKNCESSVATVSLQKEFLFNDQNRLIDSTGRVIPIVHQWDRIKQHYDQFFKLAME